jgi:hypothetical protein
LDFGLPFDAIYATGRRVIGVGERGGEITTSGDRKKDLLRPALVRRIDANFSYQAQSWSKLRPFVAKVESHPGPLSARHSGAIDRGGRRRDQMHPAVVLHPSPPRRCASSFTC